MTQHKDFFLEVKATNENQGDFKTQQKSTRAQTIEDAEKDKTSSCAIL